MNLYFKNAIRFSDSCSNFSTNSVRWRPDGTRRRRARTYRTQGFRMLEAVPVIHEGDRLAERNDPSRPPKVGLSVLCGS